MNNTALKATGWLFLMWRKKKGPGVWLDASQRSLFVKVFQNKIKSAVVESHVSFETGPHNRQLQDSSLWMFISNHCSSLLLIKFQMKIGISNFNITVQRCPYPPMGYSSPLTRTITWQIKTVTYACYISLASQQSFIFAYKVGEVRSDRK